MLAYYLPPYQLGAAHCSLTPNLLQQLLPPNAITFFLLNPSLSHILIQHINIQSALEYVFLEI